MAHTVVRARIDEHIKEEAAAVLASVGLTVSDAFRLMLMRIATEARRGGLTRHPNVEALFKALNQGD